MPLTSVMPPIPLNTEFTILPSAARTGPEVISPTQVNDNARGGYVQILVTVNPGGGQTLRVRIRWVNTLTGAVDTLLQDVPQTFAGFDERLYLLYPGAGAAADGVDLVNAFPLPRSWLVSVTHSGAGSWTYSVTGAYIL